MEMIRVEVRNDRIHARWGQTSAEIDAGRVCIGHLGCKLLGTLKQHVPPHLAEQWDQEFGRAQWRSTQNAKPKLATSLEMAIDLSGMKGAVFWDTMRTGSDYWRPGKLLTEAVGLLPDRYAGRVAYAREDGFCPPRELLSEFMANEQMGFGEYAQRYAEYLNTGDRIPLAMVSVVFDLARSRLPIFYCVDPYIPHYADPRQFCSDIPYTERSWIEELRTDGCHRLVLVEEIVKAFYGHGIHVWILELISTFEDCRSANRDESF
ncbi:hypothetical protein [uncultured Thiocystis sp.]|uniref:hypothetical protein n=1 Tax=uncultured Thiocystis sp. TaxID=1202134 RepID=UPI0025FAF94B|nr:hypothetical protein [uncultured Thiocystis sp.]